MSKSGIPVISQVAQIADTVVTSIGDIFEGKNVFESLGRIIGAPIAAVGDLANDLTFNSLANQPILQDFFQGSREFSENPYSKQAAEKLASGVGKAGLVAVGSGVVTPFGLDVPASLGVSKFTGGVGTLAASEGNFGAIANLVAPGAIPDDLKNLYGDVKGYANELLAASARPASAPAYRPYDVPSSNPPQVIPVSKDYTTFLIAGVAVLAVLVMVRK